MPLARASSQENRPSFRFTAFKTLAREKPLSQFSESEISGTILDSPRSFVGSLGHTPCGHGVGTLTGDVETSRWAW
jgi:hypothetical protein